MITSQTFWDKKLGNGLNYKLHAQTETIIEYIVDVGGYHECPKRYNHDLGGKHFFIWECHGVTRFQDGNVLCNLNHEFVHVVHPNSRSALANKTRTLDSSRFNLSM